MSIIIIIIIIIIMIIIIIRTVFLLLLLLLSLGARCIVGKPLVSQKCPRTLWGACFYRCLQHFATRTSNASKNSDIASRKTEVFSASAMYSQCIIIGKAFWRVPCIRN